MQSQNEREVSIYMRTIKLDVVIPGQFVWEFMESFGRIFAVQDTHEGTRNFKSVDGYFYHPNGWHVQVTVPWRLEEKFYVFLEDFCKMRGLSFQRSGLESIG